jgi:hypothetical protein
VTHGCYQEILRTLGRIEGELYNVARESWLTYRGALATNTPSDAYFQQLTKNLTDLTDAIRAIERR